MSLLIFDCDGVLVDSEQIALDSLATMLTALGRPSDAAECGRLFMGMSLRDVLATIEAMLGRALPEDFGAKANAALFERFRRELRPVAGVAEAIEKLADDPRCVASSSQPERIKLSLEVTGLAPLFGTRIFSAVEVAQGKPAPDLFLYAAQRCGVAPADCIVIEDSPVGIIAARSAAMAAVGFTGASHADTALAHALAAAGADLIVARMADLPSAVENLRAQRMTAAGREPAPAAQGKKS